MSQRRTAAHQGASGSNQYQTRPGGPVLSRSGRARSAAAARSVAEPGSVQLTGLVLDADAQEALTRSWKSGTLRRLVPELEGLERLGTGDAHARHKHQLWHTFQVVGMCPPDRERLRLAALFHDIAKGETRRVENGAVTFRHHEERGARTADRRLRALGYPDLVASDVATIVRLSGRHKDSDLWSDSAVRRLMTDAGDTLPDLVGLFRADCTTRHEWKFHKIQEQVDALEARIAEVTALDASRAAVHARVVTGQDIMNRYDIEPGPQVGRLLKELASRQRDLGRDLTPDEAWALLDAYHDKPTP